MKGRTNMERVHNTMSEILDDMIDSGLADTRVEASKLLSKMGKEFMKEREVERKEFNKMFKPSSEGLSECEEWLE